MRFLTGNSSATPTAARAGTAAAFAVLLGLLLASAAVAAGLQDKLDRKEDKLGQVRERQGILTSELERMGQEIARLQETVSTLRSREIVVEAELAEKQGELDAAAAELARARDHLDLVRERLRRALIALRDRLVEIYHGGSPDLLAAVVNADDFSAIATQSEYLNRIQESDEALAARVGELRDRARAVVASKRQLRDRIAAARDAIAEREAALHRTRVDLEARKDELAVASGSRRRALAALNDREAALEGDLSELQAKIQAQLGGISGGPYPTGPTSAPGTFAWPIDGTLTSPFGPRWGRQHEGIDVAAAEGTPIWAAADGTVVVRQGVYESGGYGNFTCLDHGGGLATCYAHQSAFNVSAGQSVSQGEVIGFVGNTGNSFGAHVHFEVRAGGVAQDPLGYL